MANLGVTPKFGDDIALRLRDLESQMRDMGSNSSPQKSDEGRSFFDHMKSSVQDVDAMQKTADKLASDLSAGKTENIHEVMLAASEAQLGFNMLVQVRNKMLEAYQEVMRMQV